MLRIGPTYGRDTPHARVHSAFPPLFERLIRRRRRLARAKSRFSATYRGAHPHPRGTQTWRTNMTLAPVPPRATPDSHARVGTLFRPTLRTLAAAPHPLAPRPGPPHLRWGER